MTELSRLLGTTGHPSSEAGYDAVAQGGLAADVVKDLLDKRIVIETAASDGIEILITAGLVAIGAKTGSLTGWRRPSGPGRCCFP